MEDFRCYGCCNVKSSFDNISTKRCGVDPPEYRNIGDNYHCVQTGSQPRPDWCPLVLTIKSMVQMPALLGAPSMLGAVR